MQHQPLLCCTAEHEKIINQPEPDCAEMCVDCMIRDALVLRIGHVLLPTKFTFSFKQVFPLLALVMHNRENEIRGNMIMINRI